MKSKLKFLLFSIALLIPIIVLGQTINDQPKDNWLNDLDVYTKIFGSIVATISVILGLPLAIINFKKTKAEIRKLELESKAIQQVNSQQNDSGLKGNYINVKDSSNVNIKVFTDPRFLGPLLLLLDFIIAFILTSLLSTLLSIFEVPLDEFILLIFSITLFVPILRESWRVRKNLKPKEIENKETKSKET